MKPGKLRKKWPDQTQEATVGPEGWVSKDAAFAAHLNTAFPVGGTTAGVGWVRAFWEAIHTLRADAVVEPVADFTPGRIY